MQWNASSMVYQNAYFLQKQWCKKRVFINSSSFLKIQYYAVLKLKTYFIVQVLNSKLGITLRVSVTSATILTAKSRELYTKIHKHGFNHGLRTYSIIKEIELSRRVARFSKLLFLYVSLLMSALSRDETRRDSSLALMICTYTVIKTVFMYFCLGREDHSFYRESGCRCDRNT